jgi:hypothetical protein
MQYSEKFVACRDIIIKAQILKNNNNHLFERLLELDEKLISTDEILYHLPSYRLPGKIIEKIVYAVVKENYDAEICKKYNFIKSEKLSNQEHSNDLFENIKEVSILEIEYYSRLNECYIQELENFKVRTL